MKQITFWFDPISPFAYLAFERLPQALEGLSYSVRYRPVLFAGMLKTWGQKGPAEIEPKRAWTFRHVQWLAHRHGIELQTPLQHPFNPLALLRLLLACADDGVAPNRLACERVLRHVWRGGLDANDPQRLAALAQALSPRCDPAAAAVKHALKSSTDEAIALGLFGVPTLELDGRLFWGLDSLDMVADALRGATWFDGPRGIRRANPGRASFAERTAASGHPAAALRGRRSAAACIAPQRKAAPVSCQRTTPSTCSIARSATPFGRIE